VLPTRRRRRAALPIGVMVIGTGLAAAAFAGGVQGAATGILLATILSAAAIWILGGTGGDLAAILRSDPDERQALIRLRAGGVAAVVLFVICAAMAGRTFAQGESAQPYLDLCIVAALTYGASILWLKHRR
jgi:hypothetical protein